MGSHHYSSSDCYNILKVLLPPGFSIENITIGYQSPDYYLYGSSVNLTYEKANFLVDLCSKVDGLEAADKYSKPIMWIGFYIAIASSFCTAAMAADLLHGFRNRKLWFPCKYFSLNAASITMITVAMKLTVDMSTPMPSDVDQAAKLGSMVFMCTMMANSMPSLGSMGNKSSLANVIGLVILIITIIVNICIEISTGEINHENYTNSSVRNHLAIKVDYTYTVYIYLSMMLLLLIIMISFSITIPTIKQILEYKYQLITKTTVNDEHPQHTTLEYSLRQYVIKNWIMVHTSSPQVVMASNPLSFASGAICTINIILLGGIFHHQRSFGNVSDYKVSTFAIVITQIFGIVVGSIAPMCRCFSVLSFQLTHNLSRNDFMDFKVEKYWTQKLCEWKESQIPFLSTGRRLRNIVHKLKNIILSICIGFQKVIVVSCKMIQLILVVVALFFGYCCSYSWNSLKETLSKRPIALSSDNMSKELGNYVLQLEDGTRLTEKTLMSLSKSINCLIQKAEKEQHHNILKLLENCTGFWGVENFDSDQVQPLLSVELSNNWSLPIVTLTCIAVALPNIHKDISNSLFKSVSEGLFYTHLVEENLNKASEYANIHRAATTLWHEVENNCRWLENTLKRSAYNGKTPLEILEWFTDKAKEIVKGIKPSTEQVRNFSNKQIAANAMYRIAQTILLNYQSKIEPITEEELFVLLYGMIAEIVVACLTNIPQVITSKCHENEIEKREASVEAATKLFGRSINIINRLEARELPNMDQVKMAFIDEWRLHLKQSIP